MIGGDVAVGKHIAGWHGAVPRKPMERIGKHVAGVDEIRRPRLDAGFHQPSGAFTSRGEALVERRRGSMGEISTAPWSGGWGSYRWDQLIQRDNDVQTGASISARWGPGMTRVLLPVTSGSAAGPSGAPREAMRRRAESGERTEDEDLEWWTTGAATEWVVRRSSQSWCLRSVV